MNFEESTQAAIDALAGEDVWRGPDLVEIAHLTDDAINRLNELEIERAYAEPRRDYLGLSGCGRKCARQIWYDFRWASPRKIDPRHQRRAETGRRREERTVADLNEVGIETRAHDDSGDQFEISMWNGLVKGHTDGLVMRGVPEAPKTEHLFEHKCCVSAKYDWDFDEYALPDSVNYETPMGQREDFDPRYPGKFWMVQRDGIQKAVPTWYDQVQAYMGCSRIINPETGNKLWKDWGLSKPLSRAFFWVVNTDLDIFYYERIYFDLQHSRRLMQRVWDILVSPTPPKRHSEDPMDWECVFCEHRETCHTTATFVESCRTCSNGKVEEHPEHGPRWVCSIDYDPEERQFVPCHDWEPIEDVETF